MKNLKIISGGQTGADIAGLKAAKALGIPTGGNMPKGFMTERGPQPEYAELYGITELGSKSYPQRTAMNIAQSDFTFVFSDERASRGTALTMNECIRQARPYWLNPDVDFNRHLMHVRKNIAMTTINVAGNRESVAPGIEQRVYNLLMEAFGNG